MNSAWAYLKNLAACTLGIYGVCPGTAVPPKAPPTPVSIQGPVSGSGAPGSEIVGGFHSSLRDDLPSCGPLLAGTLLAKNGVLAAATSTGSSDDTSNALESADSGLGGEPGRHASYALLRDGRIMEMQAGTTHDSDGCQNGLIREFTPKQSELSIGAGGEIMLIGEAANPEHVSWLPLPSTESQEDPLQLLHACRGLPSEPIRVKAFSVYPGRAPLTGRLVHFEWAPSTTKPSCDGFGSMFAYLSTDGSCQVFQRTSYECAASSLPGVMSDAVGLIDFSKDKSEEILLIIGYAGYESRSLVSLSVSKSGKVSLGSCGTIFVGGC